MSMCVKKMKRTELWEEVEEEDDEEEDDEEEDEEEVESEEDRFPKVLFLLVCW